MEIQNYLKSLNPKEDQKHILIYGKEYKLFRDGKYIGNAFWTEDENVGDSFQIIKEKDENGYFACEVFVADSWELIIKKETLNQ